MIEIAVFICGAVLMIFELVGSRVLAPYLGTSIVVWTNLIGIILGSLSVGYWLGGKVADINPRKKFFALLILASGLCIGLTRIINSPVLSGLEQFAHVNHFATSFVAVLILFTPASIFLGMITPYAARLKLKHIATSGRTVGNLYALSTAGSIAGTFFGGLILISYLGINNILLLLSGSLILTSLLVYGKGIFRNKFLVVVLFFLFGLVFSLSEKKTAMDKSYLENIDSRYNHIQIYDVPDQEDGKTVRILKLDNAFSSAMFVKDDDLVWRYTKYFRLASHFKPDIKSVLMIGGAGYSYPKDFLKRFPEATMDVVEIDPKVTELAKKYFHVPSDRRLNIYSDDGRIFLNKNMKKYDVIFSDAFKAKSIPYHLTTREAVQKMYDSLDESGVLVLSIISAIEGQNGKFLRAEYRTLASIFPQVYIFPISHRDNPYMVRNLIMVGLKDKNRPKLTSTDSELNDYLSYIWKKDIVQDAPILTDDFAPVDQYNKAFF